MPRHKLHRGISRQPGGRDEVRAFQSQRLASGKAGILGPADHRQGKHRVLQPSVQQGGNRQGQNQAGESQAHIRRAHHQGVRRAAQMAAQDADDGPRCGDDGHQGKGGQHAGPQADQNTGQHISAEAIRPGGMPHAGRLQDGKDLRIGVIRAELPGETDNDQENRRDQQKADKPLPCVILPDLLPADSNGIDHPFLTPSRMRGSSAR